MAHTIISNFQSTIWSLTKPELHPAQFQKLKSMVKLQKLNRFQKLGICDTAYHSFTKRNEIERKRKRKKEKNYFTTPLSPTPSLASSPSLRPHHTTHWPHSRSATTSSEHSWGQPPPYNWRNYQSPAPRSSSTATRLPGDLDRTFQLPYGSKFSSPSMICRTRAGKQRQSWSHSASYGRACGRIAAPGHVIVSPASAPKSPVTQ
jgi:hypothetical protein